jgi:hypothetical protein
MFYLLNLSKCHSDMYVKFFKQISPKGTSILALKYSSLQQKVKTSLKIATVLFDTS